MSCRLHENWRWLGLSRRLVRSHRCLTSMRSRIRLKCWLYYIDSFIVESKINYFTCIGAEVPRDVQSLAAASAISAAAGVSSTMLVTMFSSTSSSSSNSFGMINQIQLVILLPLIGAFLPQKIYDYLKSMNASLFNLSFLPQSNSQSLIDFKSWFDFKQPD